MIQATLIKWGVIALIILAAFASGYVRGKVSEAKKLPEYIAKQAQEGVRIITLQGKVTERIVNHYIKVAGKTEYVTNTIKEEVTKYAEANPTDLCIDAEFVRLHNAAALNASPKPPAAPSGSLRTTSAGYWNAYRIGGLGHGDAELR
jgi:hypothetical protein